MVLKSFNKFLREQWFFIIINLAYFAFIFYWADWRQSDEYDKLYEEKSRAFEIAKAYDTNDGNGKLEYHLVGYIDGKGYDIDVTPETYFTNQNNIGETIYFTFNNLELLRMRHEDGNAGWQGFVVAIFPIILFFVEIMTLAGFDDDWECQRINAAFIFCTICLILGVGLSIVLVCVL